MFYLFLQNNSGGNFDELEPGIFHLLLEADNSDEACDLAQHSEYDIYFDGVEKGMDCECCGDRWYSPFATYDSVEDAVKGSCRFYDVVCLFKDGHKVIFKHTVKV